MHSGDTSKYKLTPAALALGSPMGGDDVLHTVRESSGNRSSILYEMRQEAQCRSGIIFGT